VVAVSVAPGGQPPTGQEEFRNPLEDETGGLSGGGDERVRVDEHQLVDLHVNDEDIANVLQLLSIESERNILASNSVSGTVTANLYGVTFFEALDAILHVNGFGYIEEGNFVYVYTLEELEEIKKASLQIEQRVFRLDYLTAVDAAEFVKPLLSEAGQIKTNGVTEAFGIPDSAPAGADQFANEGTMIVYDYGENIEAIAATLAEIDTKPAQVLIEATILQTSLSEANAFGIDFSIVGSLDFQDFAAIGGPLQAADSLIAGQGARVSSDGSSGGSGGGSGTGTDGGTGSGSGTQVPIPGNGQGNAIVSSPGNTDGSATLKMGLVDGDFAVFLRLLDEVSDTTILSRPNLLTLNRQPARVLVGRKVGFLNTTSTDTATTQTVEFLDTGTQLYVRPFVSDDRIRLELKPQVSEAIIRQATDASGAAVTIPDELTNELTTNVIVRDGQTIVLGGLFRENVQAVRRQVPVVGDIPLIGAAFRGHDDNTERSEIIFMVTPSLVSDQILLDQAERAQGEIERVMVGTRAGLLPWSREKRSSQLNVKARKFAEEGEYEKALHCVRRSLSLNPRQTDAIALRDRILGKESQTTNRNLLDEIVEGELEALLESIPSPAVGRAYRKSLEESRDEVARTQKDEIAPLEDDDTSETAPSIGAAPRFDLEVENVELPVVLDELVERSGRNILFPEEIEGVVSAALYDVTLHEALDAVLRPAGYDFLERGDSIRVIPAPGSEETVADAETEELSDASGWEDRFEIDVEDAPLEEVLTLLAEQSGRNIIGSDSVEGVRVSVELRDASLREALGAVLSPDGLGFVDREDAIFVLTVDELAQLEALESEDDGSAGETESETPAEVVAERDVTGGNALDAGESAKRPVEAPGEAQTPEERPVTLHASDTPLEVVLERIAEQTGVEVFATPLVAGQVSIELESAPLAEAMERILSGSGLSWLEHEGSLFVFQAARPSDGPEDLFAEELEWTWTTIDLTAVDRAFVEQLANSMLSPESAVDVSASEGEPLSVVVYGIASNVDQLEGLLLDFDRRLARGSEPEETDTITEVIEVEPEK